MYLKILDQAFEERPPLILRHSDPVNLIKFCAQEGFKQQKILAADPRIQGRPKGKRPFLQIEIRGLTALLIGIKAEITAQSQQEVDVKIGDLPVMIQPFQAVLQITVKGRVWAFFPDTLS